MAMEFALCWREMGIVTAQEIEVLDDVEEFWISPQAEKKVACLGSRMSSRSETFNMYLQSSQRKASFTILPPCIVIGHPNLSRRGPSSAVHLLRQKTVSYTRSALDISLPLR
jgi:hypothetical protein